MGEGSASRPGRTLPPGKTRYPLYRRLGRPQDRSGQVRKISPPPGIDPRTVQPVGSRNTDYAIGLPSFRVTRYKYRTNVAIINKTEVDTVGQSEYIPSFSVICGNKMPTRCNRWFLLQILLLTQHVSGTKATARKPDTQPSAPHHTDNLKAPNTTGSKHLCNTLELLMMGIMVPETCWASNKICNKNHLLHLVGILFPHINDDARWKPH